MLNYATIKPNEQLTFKVERNLDSYNTLKKELDDAIFSMIEVYELDLYFDDEFLLHEENPIPTVIIKNSPTNHITDRDIVLCGNVVFVSSDNEGNTVSLTEAAKKRLAEFIPVRLGETPVLLYQNF